MCAVVNSIPKFYLYRHIRLDKNEPFYIGIGNREKETEKTFKYRRAYEKNGRNKYWHNIVNKTEYEVEILVEDNNQEFIKQKEIEFIALYGRKNLGKGPLCNLTDGGDGITGAIRTDETKRRLSISKIGEKNHRYGKKHTHEWSVYMSLIQSGKNNPNYGKTIPDWHKEINRKAQLGRKHSPETLIKKELNIQKKIEKLEKGLPVNKLGFRKPVIDTTTQEIFSSISKAAKSIRMRRSTLEAKLRGQTYNNTNFIYYNIN